MRNLVKFNTGKPLPNPPLQGEGTSYKIVDEIEVAGEIKSAYKIAEKFCQV